MTSVAVGPFHFLPVGSDVEDRLPRPNSVRRACEETRCAVTAASELLKESGVSASDRLGVYVGQQQVALDYTTQFVDASYRDGPRFASPMLFSESVANNAATHLTLTLGLRGVAQTFVGTRVAGIQAAMAAREDVLRGDVDTGLVLVLGGPTDLTRTAYERIYYGRMPGPALPFLRGALAFLVRREAAGMAGLWAAGVRTEGRSAASLARAAESLGRSAGLPGRVRLVDSILTYARQRGVRVPDVLGEVDVPPADRPESFAIDPFLRLMEAAELHPQPEVRAVVCLGEEGTAGLLGLAGPVARLR